MVSQVVVNFTAARYAVVLWVSCASAFGSQHFVAAGRPVWATLRPNGSQPAGQGRTYCAACDAIFLSISSFNACRLKLAPFCIGGNSKKVSAAFAISC